MGSRTRRLIANIQRFFTITLRARTLRWISTGNVVRLAVSVILAFVLWGFVTWDTNPEITETYQNLTIETRNLPGNLELTDSLPTATVTVKGPQNVTDEVSAEDVDVWIDLSDLETPGVTEHQVQVSAPEGIRRVIVEPEQVNVNIDRIVSEQRDLEIIQPLEPPENLTSVEPATDTVTVIGTRQNVDRVDHVEATLDIGGRRETFTATLEPVAVNAAGGTVESVTVEPASVEVRVTFEATSKSVEVVVMCTCTTNGDTAVQELEGATAIPPTVRISGPESAITSINQIPTVPIDRSALETSGISEVELDASAIPDTVTISESSVAAWIPVPTAQRNFSDIPIQAINVGPNLQLSLSQENASFRVEGPIAVLESLDERPPKAIVNAEGRGPGTYTADVQVILPQSLSYSQLSPQQVEITLTETVEPTTTPSGTSNTITQQ